MRHDLTPINDDTSLVSCGTLFIETCIKFLFASPVHFNNRNCWFFRLTQQNLVRVWCESRPIQYWQQSILSMKVFRRAWENERLAKCELYLGFEEMGEMPSSRLLSNSNNNCFLRRQMEFSELRKIYRITRWKEQKDKSICESNYCFDNKSPARTSFPCQAVGMN
jgi:hypothetical protein